MTFNKRPLGVLVSSVGTASAMTVIKALKRQNEIPVYIVAIDVDILAPGLHMADKYYLVPPATDASYVDTIIEICKKENLQCFIPTFSKELKKIAENKLVFEKNNIKTFISPSNVIDLCNDKRRMYDFVKKLGIKTPATYTINEAKSIQFNAFPLFVKPITGSSSIGAIKINNQAELDNVLNTYKDVVIQDFVKGDEVTVDIICDENSVPLVISPRTRLVVKSGQTFKGNTFQAPNVEESVNKLCKALGIIGPCNIQFFIVNGEPIFIEVNPRFAAGGLMLTIQAGANIPLILLKLMLGQPISRPECQVKPNMYMTRFLEEIILDGNSIGK